MQNLLPEKCEQRFSIHTKQTFRILLQERPVNKGTAMSFVMQLPYLQ